MEKMMAWFEALPPMLQMFWGCALISSAFFLLQTILMLVGMESTDIDVDVDADTMDLGGGLSLFSIKNLVNFFLGFGWFGVSFYDRIASPELLAALAVLTGASFVALFVFLLKKMMKLESNGAFRIDDCRGLLADVYLRIPASREGCGKVQISVGGSVHELDGMTDGEALPTGTKVHVKDVLDEQILLVERV